MADRTRHAGYSLLEVILALAILGGAIAVLGEAARQALGNARSARDMATAQSLCESKMSEIVANLAPLETAQGTAVPSSGIDRPAWLYRVETEPLEEDGLFSVRVTVFQDMPAAKHPATFSLVCWVADPNVASVTDSSATSGEGDTP